MLLTVLRILFFIVLIRFVVRFVAWMARPREIPREVPRAPHPRAERPRIVDVEFTEERPGKDPR